MSGKRKIITTCFEKKTDCNRYFEGNCELLLNTVFKKPCPFYKSVYEEMEEAVKREKKNAPPDAETKDEDSPLCSE